jgi:hypothetical protein
MGKHSKTGHRNQQTTPRGMVEMVDTRTGTAHYLTLTAAKNGLPQGRYTAICVRMCCPRRWSLATAGCACRSQRRGRGPGETPTSHIGLPLPVRIRGPQSHDHLVAGGGSGGRHHVVRRVVLTLDTTMTTATALTRAQATEVGRRFEAAR